MLLTCINRNVGWSWTGLNSAVVTALLIQFNSSSMMIQQIIGSGFSSEYEYDIACLHRWSCTQRSFTTRCPETSWRTVWNRKIYWLLNYKKHDEWSIYIRLSLCWTYFVNIGYFKRDWHAQLSKYENYSSESFSCASWTVNWTMNWTVNWTVDRIKQHLRISIKLLTCSLAKPDVIVMEILFRPRMATFNKWTTSIIHKLAWCFSLITEVFWHSNRGYNIAPH